MAAPSASSYGWSYDVFLNFRGVDTCKTFTGHLYNALESAGIHTFGDDKLRTGEEIGLELLSAIQQSRISIPIFSKNYASSKWCLNELVKIVECRKTMNQLVLPIFYDVDPSDVCNQTGNYEEAFQKHNNHFHQRIIDEWKEALREVGVLKRWDLKNIANGHEATLVQLVVAAVINKLRKDSRIVSNDLVGIQSHAEKMMSLLNIKSGDVKIVGVWGLGGIGKTTIANVVYNVGGSSLFRVQRSAWQCTLKMLQEIPNEEVQKKLRISFDGLRDWQQGIFLDIACFFIGMDKNIAYYIWNQCGFYAEIGIDVLCQKSLVKIGENNELKMHDQLRDLGREIIRQENLKVPGEHSRLWFHQVAMHVLEKHMDLLR
ncbi:disease resistance protein Roq1-like isoform X2 [Macadamia integrifolia]|uniref:disease resistance protein Roq1-like isoform X2 n=1 Tax=Macadamia integrifolia TaxID=60698 RepID=UPI001C4F5A90|nr:disease resistance protein Roq1-like isoform X2 [Macadamia integrifolia]